MGSSGLLASRCSGSRLPFRKPASLPAGGARIDHRKRYGKPQEYAAHGDREKKRICWHTNLQRLEVEYPPNSKLAFDSNQIWPIAADGSGDTCRSHAPQLMREIAGLHEAYIARVLPMKTRVPRQDLLGTFTLSSRSSGALPQGFSGGGDPVVFSARRGRLSLNSRPSRPPAIPHRSRNSRRRNRDGRALP